MSLTTLSLQGLLRRAQVALQRGYEIALGTHYARELGGTDGSAAGLVALCRAALTGHRNQESPPHQSQGVSPAAKPPAASSEAPTWPPAAPALPIEPEPATPRDRTEPEEAIEFAALVDPAEADEEPEPPSVPSSTDGTLPKKASRRRRGSK